MTAPRLPRAAPVGGRPTLARSVLLSQLLVAAALLANVLLISVLQPSLLAQATVFSGLATIFALTAVTFVVPWGRIAWWLTVLVPLVDIAGIFLLQLGSTTLSFALLFVFPVIWLTTYYGAFGRIVAPALCTVLCWLCVQFPLSISDLALAVFLPIVLVFVTTSTYLTQRRNAAQRVLLTRQATFLDEALDDARRQEHVLQVIIDAVDFSVIALEADGSTALLNKATFRMADELGFDARRLAEYTDIYRADGTTPFPVDAHPYLRVLAGEDLDREVMWFGPPGERRVAISVSSRKLYDRAGKLFGYVTVGQDITAEVNAIRARDDLVTSVSHELRTPLTSILGYLDLAMDEESLSPSVARRLEVASKNAERLLDLVSNLLVSGQRRSEMGYVLNPARVDIAHVAKEAMEAITPIVHDQGIEIALSAEEGVEVFGDAAALRQVLDNLLSNATKYNAEHGSVALQVARVAGDTVEMSVSDTGRGMTEEEQRHIFDRFYRAESARNSGVRGTGLGLAIVRDIVEQHRGSIRVRSARGEGTTITVSLPALPASAQASVPEAATAPGKGGAAEPPAPAEPPTAAEPRQTDGR